MIPGPDSYRRLILAAAVVLLGLILFNQLRRPADPVMAKQQLSNAVTNNGPAAGSASPSEQEPQASPPDQPAATNNVAPLTAEPVTPALTADRQPEPSKNAAATETTASDSASTESSDEIQLSFSGANVDMVVQWLAKTTGKSVVKHPRVQCELTIVSSKKVSTREAVSIVYRALALQGFTAIESQNSILLVPEGQEPKMIPELLASSSSGIPDGRQRLVKVFHLNHVSPSELKQKLGTLTSEKGTIEADDHGNRIIVTDYTDNIRLLTELIPELDVASVSDAIVEIFPVKHLEAQDLSDLLTLILNQQPGNPGATAQPNKPGPPQSSGPSASPSASGPNQQIRLWPDKISNRLIVSAPQSKMPEVAELIETLDVEKPADVGVRVLPLKHVSAGDLVKEVGPLYQKMSGKSLKETIEITANDRSNSLIVLSSEENFKGLQKLVATLDTADAEEKVLESFPLENADAEDVAKQLQDLYRDQPTTSRYVYYFSTPTAKKELSVVADRRRNTVIVQASPASLPSIREIIKTLDEPVTDDTLAPRIFTLKYVSAADIELVLNELFLKKEEQRSYWDYYYAPQEESRQDAGRLYGKVRITSEPHSNSIIVTSNSAESLGAVEEVLRQLDVPSQAGETTLRIPIRFAQSVNLATSINVLFATSGSPPLRPVAQPSTPNDNRNQPQSTTTSKTSFELEQEREEEAYYPWLGGQQESVRSGDGRTTVRPVSDLVGRVRVVPDRRSNALLVTCNVHFFPQVIKLINELDAPTSQVVIEAKIVEVASDFRERLGVRWSPDGSRTFEPEDLDNSFMPSATAAHREIFAGALADSLRTGTLDASISLDFLIQFLRKNSGSTVLAEPQLNVRDNELGRLFVGAQVPFISRSTFTDVGGRNDQFDYKDVGIILEVSPHIKNEEEVALRIRAESSSIRNGQTLFGGAILDTRDFRTDLLVKDGDTVVLGGIIQQEESDTIRKVPLLGSIPVIGWAFKKRDKASRQVELMVFLRPKILRNSDDVRDMLHEAERKTPNLQRWKDRNAENQEGEAPL